MERMALQTVCCSPICPKPEPESRFRPGVGGSNSLKEGSDESIGITLQLIYIGDHVLIRVPSPKVKICRIVREIASNIFIIFNIFCSRTSICTRQSPYRKSSAWPNQPPPGAATRPRLHRFFAFSLRRLRACLLTPTGAFKLFFDFCR